MRGELGRGALGVVYVAWEAEHDRTAAVKLFTSAPKDATAAIARLRRDAQAAGALGHPNIAAVLGVGDHEGQPWVATEFVPGVSLAQVLRSRAPMPIERVLDVWRQLARAWPTRTARASSTSTSSRPTSASTPRARSRWWTSARGT